MSESPGRNAAASSMLTPRDPVAAPDDRHPRLQVLELLHVQTIEAFSLPCPDRSHTGRSIRGFPGRDRSTASTSRSRRTVSRLGGIASGDPCHSPSRRHSPQHTGPGDTAWPGVESNNGRRIERPSATLGVTPYVLRVQRPPRLHIRLAGLPQDLQILVDALRLARTAPLAGRQPPTVPRF